MHLPKPLQKFKDGWMAVSHVIGLVMSKILLTAFWIVAVGIYAIILKIANLFHRTKKTDSYWINVENMEQNVCYQF